MNVPALPDFTSANFLHSHIKSILAFYEPNVRADDGGFHQCFRDDGSVYDSGTRHLVSSTRFVFNYAMAYRAYGTKHYEQWAGDGFDFLQRVHRQSSGHYAWIIEDGKTTDNSAMAYGHAFVMLAAASCAQIGIASAVNIIDEVWDFLETYLWVERAKALYSAAMSKGWDDEHQGLVYGFAPDGKFADSHKYFWVHAESIATAWRLYRLTNEQHYLDDYQRLWQYSWNTLIDHDQGAWFRIRNRDGSAFDALKSPPGKTDYHTMGACWDVLAVQ